MLSGAAVDLRATQVVNGVKGIHAMLPKALFATPPSLAAGARRRGAFRWRLTGPAASAWPAPGGPFPGRSRS